MKIAFLVLALSASAQNPLTEFYQKASAVESADAEGKRDEAAKLLAALDIPEGTVGAYLRRAELRARLGEFDGAEKDMRAALVVSPKDFQVLCNLVQFLRERSRLADSLEAANILVTVTEGIPAHNRAEKWLQRGETYMRLERFDEAEADIALALRDKPDDIPSLWLMVQALMRRGDPKRALPFATRMVEAGAPGLEKARALAQRGQVKEALGDAVGAEADMTAAIAEDPTEAVALEALMQRLRAQGRLKEALELSDKMIAASHASPPTRRAILREQRAQTRRLAGDLKGAEEDAREALRIEPDAASPLRALTELLVDLDRAPEALKTADALVKVMGNATGTPRAEAFVLRARVLDALGRSADAAADLASAKRAAPDSPAALKAGARRARADGRASEAADLSARLVSGSSTAPASDRYEAFVERALAYADLGRRDDAVKDLQTAATLAENGALVDAFLRLDRPDLALPLAEKFVVSASSAEKSEALERRARVREATGKAGDALADFAAAVEAGPSRRGPRLGAARLLAKLGRSDEAMAAADALVAVSSGAVPADAAEALVWRAGRRAAGGDIVGAEADHAAAEGILPGHHARSPDAAGAWASVVARRSRPEALALLARLRAHPASGAKERAALNAVEAEARWTDGDAKTASLRMVAALRLDAKIACLGAPLLSDRSVAAAGYFDACVARFPKDAGLRTDRGVARWRRGQKALALTDFRAALSASPGFLPAALSLAAGLEQSGRKADAAAVLSKALEHADPGAEPAEAARLELARLIKNN